MLFTHRLTEWGVGWGEVKGGALALLLLYYTLVEEADGGGVFVQLFDRAGFFPLYLLLHPPAEPLCYTTTALFRISPSTSRERKRALSDRGAEFGTVKDITHLENPTGK